jgi:hypothetical protein
VDEAASGRAPGGLALRDRQTGWQGSLGREAAFRGCLFAVHESGSGPSLTLCEVRSCAAIAGITDFRMAFD